MKPAASFTAISASIFLLISTHIIRGLFIFCALVALPIIKSLAEGTNLHIYREAEGILVDHLFEKMLEKAVKENKKSIIFVSGAAGSGKSTSVKNNKKFINLANEGLVFDSAFNRYEGLAERIEQAKKAGMEKITVVAVYNDAETTFKNSIERGKKIGRFLPLQYFLDQSFGKSKGKLELLHKNYPDVTIIPLDNSKNNGGRKVSIKEALDWDYSVTEELLHKLLNLIDNEYKEGKLNKKQLSAITRGIQEIESLTTQRVQEIASNLERENSKDGSHDSQGEGSIRLGIDQSEYSKLEESVSIDENGTIRN